MTIGEKIRKLRNHTGLTQRALGELSGTSETTIKQYELGKRQPRIEQLKKIAKVFDFPLYLLLDDNFELENAELEMKRARPFGASEMTKRPENKPFTGPLQGRELPKQQQSKKFDFLDETYFNAIRYKIAQKEPLTEEEEAYRMFHLSKIFRIDVFAIYYFLLNKEGKSKADEIIDRAIEQIALLTKIPEYQPKLPNAPKD